MSGTAPNHGLGQPCCAPGFIFARPAATGWSHLGEILGPGLLDERAWLQNQMFFFLCQRTAEVALHHFEHLALVVGEQLACGFALWRERGDGSSGLNTAAI